MRHPIRFFFQNLNTCRLFTSGALFLFAVYCLIWNQDLPFSMPGWVYGIGFCYFALFPIRDMSARRTNTLYKGKQFAAHYEPVPELSEAAFAAVKKKYDRGAARSMLFWLCFLGVVGLLKGNGVIGREWIFFFFAMSNFCIFFAVFFWCPFHKILLKPSCCMDCRIYNWDSFFAYSFLIFLPGIYTALLVSLALASLTVWEVAYHQHPKRFFTVSNQALACEHCDLESCKNQKKKRFHKKLLINQTETNKIKEGKGTVNGKDHLNF